MASYVDQITPFLEARFDEVLSPDFYRILFPEGILQEQGESSYNDGHYNGIVLELTNKYTYYDDPKTGNRKKKRLVKRYSVTDDLDVLTDVIEGDNFALMSPLAYAGKTREAKNARLCFAIAIDLDKIRFAGNYPIGLENFLHQTGNEPGTKIGRQPLPTFIVSSGTGVHLYYVFDKPICLFTETANELQRLKRALTTRVWHDSVVDISDARDVQQEGIYQGFRVVGGVTKTGGRTRAFATGPKVSVEYLNKYVSSGEQVKKYRVYDERYLLSKEEYPKQLTFEEANKLKYWQQRNPDWYERRVVNKEPRRTWAVNRSVYDWWKEEISSKARVSHRYWCISMLAIYAVKCSHYDAEKNPNPVTYEELENDAFELVELFDSLSISEDNRFTEADVLSALEFWQDSWTFYKRDYISYRAGFDIKENKRNHRSREDHLEINRLIKKRMKERGEILNEGRPTKKAEVQIWQIEHPSGTIAECIADTGISRPTVKKWWKREGE